MGQKALAILDNQGSLAGYPSIFLEGKLNGPLNAHCPRTASQHLSFWGPSPFRSQTNGTDSRGGLGVTCGIHFNDAVFQSQPGSRKVVKITLEHHYLEVPFGSLHPVSHLHLAQSNSPQMRRVPWSLLGCSLGRTVGTPLCRWFPREAKRRWVCPFLRLGHFWWPFNRETERTLKPCFGGSDSHFETHPSLWNEPRHP